MTEAGELALAVIEGVQDYAVFALDEHGAIASWNAGAAKLTGYEDRDVIGLPWSLLSMQQKAGDAERMLSQAQASGRMAQERLWRRRDGSLVWVDERLHPLRAPAPGGAFVVIAHELTERVGTPEAGGAGEAGASRESALLGELQAAERRAAFLAEASSIMVATALDFEATVKALARLAVSRLADWCIVHTVDGSGSLKLAEVAHRDPQCEELLAEHAAGTLGEHWAEPARAVVETSQSRILPYAPLSDWRQDKTTDRELLHGVTHTCAMIIPLLGRGHMAGVVTFVSTAAACVYDEDDVALAEELGRRAAIALDNARLLQEAQEANRAKADFLAVMSHELRTPLNAIIGYSELLDGEVAGPMLPKQRHQVERIRASARHLLQLIEEIFSFARLEAGGEEVRRELVDAAALLESAAAVVRPMVESKGLQLTLAVTERDVMLETDADKLRQVILNLLSNAVKFTDRGTITLGFRLADEHAIFTVRDTGIGIPADRIAHIFEPFWQAERPNTRHVGGTGLGLSVTWRFVRMLRGRIRVESEPGSGTVFTVELPVRLTASRRERGR